MGAGGVGVVDAATRMGKGQRKRQRKRLAKLGDEARRAAKRKRQEQEASAAVGAEQQRPAEQAALIRAFHTLEKQLAAVATDPSLRDEAAREARRASLRRTHRLTIRIKLFRGALFVRALVWSQDEHCQLWNGVRLTLGKALFHR